MEPTTLLGCTVWQALQDQPIEGRHVSLWGQHIQVSSWSTQDSSQTYRDKMVTSAMWPPTTVENQHQRKRAERLHGWLLCDWARSHSHPRKKNSSPHTLNLKPFSGLAKNSQNRLAASLCSAFFLWEIETYLSKYKFYWMRPLNLRTDVLADVAVP